MNHHKHYRINTEEYQRELQELFAQKPALIKSLKTLVGELERLKKSEEFENLTPDDLLNKDVIQRIAKKRANSNQNEKDTLDSYVEVAMQKALLNTFHDPQYPEKLDMAWSNFPSSPVAMELRTSPRNWLTKTPDGQYDIDTEKFSQAPLAFSALKHVTDMSPENADKIIKKVGQSDASKASKDAIFRDIGKFAPVETLLNKQIVPASVSYDVIRDKTKGFTEHPISLEKLKELYNTHHAEDTSYIGGRFKDYVLSHPDTPKEEILDNIKNEAAVSPEVLTHKTLSPEDIKHAVKLRILNNRGFLPNSSFIGLNTKEKVDKGLAALDGLHDYVKNDPDSGSYLKDYGAHLISMAYKDPADDVRGYAFHKLLERYNNKDYLTNDPNTAAAIKANLAHGITGLIDIDTPSSQKLLKEIAKGTHSAKDKSGKVKENDLLESVLNRYRFHGIDEYKDFVNEMRKNVIESGHLPSVVNLYKKWGTTGHKDNQKTELEHIINKYGVEKAAKIIPHMDDRFLKQDVFSNPELSQKIMPHLSPAAKAKLQKDGVFPGGISKHDSPLKFSSNTEILRKLRDVAEANGGSISAKQLAQHGLNENALKVTHLKDAKGNYTKEAIQSHIDSMPRHTYDYSHTKWAGAQTHSDEKQYVFQLNHNDDILKEMQEAGVYDTFAKAHELSFNSKHPVKKNTLGWIRYTKGKDGNIHIDEVQSDLGRSLHGSIKEYLENKPDSPQKRKMEELFSKEKIDKMNDILFKGQHPSKILHEGFLQFLRDNGNVGKDVHIWQAMPKAKLAGQTTYRAADSRYLPDVIAFHKKIEANKPINDFDEAEIETAARAAIGPDEANELYKKHVVLTPGTPTKGPERIGFNLEGYKNDIVNHPMYNLTINYLKAHKTGDALESALEHPNIKDKNVRIPYTHNELPVHMKVGYHETPIKMGYEADSYGKIETQKNDKLVNQPTWKQPLRKSLKALTAEYERLLKVQFVNGTHYPELTDPIGTPHPEQRNLVVHKARDGKKVWSYHPELSRVHDRNLIQLMGGQKIAGRDNQPLPNKISSLQKPTVAAVIRFAADLIKNPDRHAMSANTDPTKPRSHAEMRVRHLISALTASNGYEIKDHPEGFEVYAPRHSKSSKAEDIATRWIYNASKKDLRSERIYPTSPDGGGGNGKRFGKSSTDRRRADSNGSRPGASSTAGGGSSNERASTAQRPRPSENSMGKAEVGFGVLSLPTFPRTQMTYPPAAKGKATHYPINYTNVLQKSERLLKANFKQLKQMFLNTNEHDHVLKWASDIKNNDLQSFYLRHYRNNPAIHTDAMKEKIGHINGMIDISDEMKKVKLNKEDTLESGLQKYEDAERKWQSGNGSRYVKPTATTKPVVDFGDGWGWFDLGASYNKDEGNALGHCGNGGNPHENDRILSLRKIHNIGGQTYHEPVATFINNEGWIGEMKGRNNSKPSEKYHTRIAELLKHKDIKGLVGAGYMPENNFHFDDLSPELKNQVKMTNPEFVDLRSNSWHIDDRTKKALNVPKIEKYQDVVNDIFKAHKLNRALDSGEITMKDIQNEDLRLVAKHSHFQREDFERMIQNVHNFSEDNKLSAYGAIKNSRHLTSDDLHMLFKNDLRYSVPILKNHKDFNANHISKIIEKDQWFAAQNLKDHKEFNANHISQIIEKNPWDAAATFKNHPLLNKQHIDKITKANPFAALQHLRNHKDFDENLINNIDEMVEKDPEAAAQYLQYHTKFNEGHISKIIEKDPWFAAQYLKDHKDFNANHISQMIEKDPRAATQYYLKDHKDFNANHISQMIEKDPWLVAHDFKDHPLLNKQHIDKITKANPFAALQHLRNHKDFDENLINNIDEMVEKDPEAAAQYLQYHTKFNEGHISKIIEKNSKLAAQYLRYHKDFNANHISQMIEKDPAVAAEQYLQYHTKFNANHISQMIEKNPWLAVDFKNHPLLNADHIGQMIEKDPWLVANYFKYHNLLNEQHIDRIVEKDPKAAARHLENNPIYKAKYGSIQKSFKQLTKEYETLKKAEDEAGMTAYSLKDGYSLHHETSQNGYDIWAIGHGGQRAGTFMICTDETRRGRPFVSWAGVDKPHRGKGIGAAVYKTLAVHYGGLDSDRNSTSTDAIKAWRRAGGKQLKIKTQFGDFRYTLEGDKKKPPVIWNEGLKKSNPLDPLIQQAKANIAMVNKVASQNPRPMLFGNKKGNQHGFVSVDPSKPNQWRITHFVKDEPSGHTEAVSFSDAIKKAHSSGYDVSKELSEEDMNKTEDLEKVTKKTANSFAGGTYENVLHEGDGFKVVSNYRHNGLYHGSPVPIDEFSISKGSGRFGNGLYLAHDENTGRFHAQGQRQGASGQRPKGEGHLYKGTLHAPVALLVTDEDEFGREALDHEDAEEAYSAVGDHLNPKVTKHWGKYARDYHGANAIVFSPSERGVDSPFTQTLAMNGSKVKMAPSVESNSLKKSEDFSRVSSVIVATDDKMLMLQRRDNNKWTFPGGHLNDTETHLEGAVRELWEEAGIRANPDEMILLGNKKTYQNKDIHVYLYKVSSEIKPSADNDPDKEAKKFEWLPHVLPEEIKSNLYIPVGDNASLSMFSMWLLRQKTNKLKELVESKKSV